MSYFETNSVWTPVDLFSLILICLKVYDWFKSSLRIQSESSTQGWNAKTWFILKNISGCLVLNVPVCIQLCKKLNTNGTEVPTARKGLYRFLVKHHREWSEQQNDPTQVLHREEHLSNIKQVPRDLFREVYLRRQCGTGIVHGCFRGGRATFWGQVECVPMDLLGKWFSLGLGRRVSSC